MSEPAINAVPPWWHPDAFARRRPHLHARAAITAAVRRWFVERGFVEVETPALQVSPGAEVHVRAFATDLDEPFGEARQRRYLHTSPEFAMKKLLVAGERRIFQLARVYRNAERSPSHSPEFTMLEWYRAEPDWRTLVSDCEGLLAAAWSAVPEAVRPPSMTWQDCRADPLAPAELLSVAEAFERHAGIDVLATEPDPAALAREARRIGVSVEPADSWEDLFFRILLDRIEPQLGVGRPTILYGYPASMAALARLDPGDPRTAQRFELYVCGLELANAFAELIDPAEQRRRLGADMDEKQRLYGERWPIDEDFIAALEHGMPESCGIALGFDRLAMLATGAARIDDVLWAPAS